jgi:hypothetical protein
MVSFKPSHSDKPHISAIIILSYHLTSPVIHLTPDSSLLLFLSPTSLLYLIIADHQLRRCLPELELRLGYPRLGVQRHCFDVLILPRHCFQRIRPRNHMSSTFDKPHEQF